MLRPKGEYETLRSGHFGATWKQVWLAGVAIIHPSLLWWVIYGIPVGPRAVDGTDVSCYITDVSCYITDVSCYITDVSCYITDVSCYITVRAALAIISLCEGDLLHGSNNITTTANNNNNNNYNNNGHFYSAISHRQGLAQRNLQDQQKCIH